MTLPPLHPACSVWDPLPNKELKKLAQDIKETTLREPIVMINGELLDGRNRWLACEMNGIDPNAHTREFGSERTDGIDPVRFAMSKNQQRRHATLNALILAAAGYANLSKGGMGGYHIDSGKPGIEPVTQQEAADAQGVTKKQVEAGKALLTYATPNVVDMVKNSDLSIDRAWRAAKVTPKDQQAEWSTPDDVPKRGKGTHNESEEIQYDFPCIPKNLKEVKLNKAQNQTITAIKRNFKDRRSQRILTIILQELWPWMPR